MAAMPLAQRGLNTSRLILGCMPFGGGWNSEPLSSDHLREAEQAVDAALEIGIRMFDHANIYTRDRHHESTAHSSVR